MQGVTHVGIFTLTTAVALVMYLHAVFTDPGRHVWMQRMACGVLHVIRPRPGAARARLSPHTHGRTPPGRGAASAAAPQRVVGVADAAIGGQLETETDALRCSVPPTWVPDVEGAAFVEVKKKVRRRRVCDVLPAKHGSD